MSIPPPGWSSTYLDEEAARREARLESSRVRRFLARVFRVVLIATAVAIPIGFAVGAFLGYTTHLINGPE